MNKSEYRKAYQLVRAVWQSNQSDLDYMIATCSLRQSCAEDDRVCSCDYEAHFHDLRAAAIEKIRADGLVHGTFTAAANCFLNRNKKMKTVNRPDLQLRLYHASRLK